MSDERALLLESGERRLVGVLHPASAPATVGVVVVVGGPQYRVGSHRQFVLLARALARAGFPALRFDYEGMGDSPGPQRSFEDVDEDLRAAVDTLLAQSPGLRSVVLWGLCDAASAALMYAPADPRVAGLVLLNPWVRTEAGLAQSYLENYYRKRLLSGAFWRKVLTRPRTLFEAGLGFLDALRQSRGGIGADPAAGAAAARRPFLVRMLDGARRFRGPVHLLLSGNDLTAGEFRALLVREATWREAFAGPQVHRAQLDDANHTFSSEKWRGWVEDRTVEAIRSLEPRRHAA
jgi:exosortase A-associated hydrolase 1